MKPPELTLLGYRRSPPGSNGSVSKMPGPVANGTSTVPPSDPGNPPGANSHPTAVPASLMSTATDPVIPSLGSKSFTGTNGHEGPATYGLTHAPDNGSHVAAG